VPEPVPGAPAGNPGRHLRILRDSTALVGSSYIDIDLEAMFDGELFADRHRSDRKGRAAT
jgi:hypothetical protein